MFTKHHFLKAAPVFPTKGSRRGISRSVSFQYAVSAPIGPDGHPLVDVGNKIVSSKFHGRNASFTIAEGVANPITYTIQADFVAPRPPVMRIAPPTPAPVPLTLTMAAPAVIPTPPAPAAPAPRIVVEEPALTILAAEAPVEAPRVEPDPEMIQLHEVHALLDDIEVNIFEPTASALPDTPDDDPTIDPKTELLELGKAIIDRALHPSG